jgi:ribosomal protein S18 acetylase RimI-like enzyme
VVIGARPYESDGDLRRMQELQQELWRLDGPRVHAHVGDLAWWATMRAGAEREWKRRLWLDDGGRCVAWAWLDRPASLDYEVHRDHRGGRLHDEVLDWFESEAEGDGPLHAWSMERDEPSSQLLQRRGYEQHEPSRSFVYYVRDLDEAVDVPRLADGFMPRTVRGEADRHERVEVHRAVWAPSRFTEESYRNVVSVWPYRADLDCVVASPDGTFVAYALCWYDDANRVGELEPVGTRPEHRRRGFGTAVCLFALRRLQEEGAGTAIVYAGGRDEDKRARSLYESIGFRQHTRMVELRKLR